SRRHSAQRLPQWLFAGSAGFQPAQSPRAQTVVQPRLSSALRSSRPPAIHHLPAGRFAAQDVLEKMARELAAHPEDKRQTERERRIAACLDAGLGACWLKDARIAALVEDALLHFDGQRYRLLAWCVMPNHVHALVETKEGFPLPEIVHSWKSFTANEANKILRRTGDFWQREYHDRFIRDDDHYRNAVVYIENNPVKAGLVKTAQAWRYSSAWSHEEQEAGKDA